MKVTNTNHTKTDDIKVNSTKRRRTTLIASSMVLCLLCVMTAVTYARYVTKATASDKARIAKWGVEISAVGTLYGAQYGDDGKAEVWDDKDKGTVHVSSSSDGNVIAPGTSNDGGLSISLSGKPEVKTNVKVELKSENIYLKAGTYAIAHLVGSDIVTEENYGKLQSTLYYQSDGKYVAAPATYDDSITKYYTLGENAELSADYYPVVYTLSSSSTSPSIAADSLNEIAKHIAGKLGTPGDPTPVKGVTTYTVNKDYEPGTDLGSTLSMVDEAISWKWEYMRSNDEPMYSAADTILGSIGFVSDDCAVLKSVEGGYSPVEEDNDYHLKTGLDLTMTVTQVD